MTTAEKALGKQPAKLVMRDFQGVALEVNDVVIISYRDTLGLGRLIKIDPYDNTVGVVEHFYRKDDKMVSHELDVAEREISKASPEAAVKFNKEFPIQPKFDQVYPVE